jgi:Spy/CpxP family protein refolding chaperone
MIGFLIGTLCLVGLFKLLRGGPWRWGGRGWGGWGRRRGRWGGEGRDEGGWDGASYFLRGLYEQLDTTPGQEKVIREAADELRDNARKLKDEVRGSRTDVAQAVRSPSFDETRIGEVFAKHDTAIESMRKAAVGAVAKVHAVLDDKQRERLAELIESGPFRGRHRRHGHGGRDRAWM